MAIRTTLLPALAALLSCAVEAAPAPDARLYEIVTETGMPHLEWNLRYAVVTERRCLARGELAEAFWMLRDVSLQDCRLEGKGAGAAGAAAADYALVCSGGHGTTGTARWTFEGERATGQLDVRLGGKNMTFWQRIAARPVADCP